MKKLFFILIFFGELLLALASYSKEEPVAETGPAFPDANFRAELVKLGFTQTNDDIDPNNPTNNALFASLVELSLTNKEIASLKGIEYFTLLTTLDCSINQLTALDLSKNTLLTELDCFSNQLTTLDVSKNTLLTKLYCSLNQLTTLDVSKNKLLTELSCRDNQLSALNLSKNTLLTLLYCYKNQLTTLKLSKNTLLSLLDCSFNQLAALNLSKNTLLTQLDCAFNQLSTLDLSMLTSLCTSTLCVGSQQPDKTLSLTLTAEQDTNIDTHIDIGVYGIYNARITKVIK